MSEERLEHTLVLIKPDALKNSLTGYVLSQLSEYHAGLRFAGAKIVNVPRMLAEEHYAEHKGKPFYPPLLDFIRGLDHYPDAPEKRRVIALVYQGVDAVKKVRRIAGPTDPHVARETSPGCVRALGSVVPIKDPDGKVITSRMDNLIHASATLPEAEREIKLWFKPTDIPPLMRPYETTIATESYYYHEGRLYTSYEAGHTLLMAPGAVVWKSDLEVLRNITENREPAYTLEAVAGKYMINEHPEW
ncbi:MAG TPA: nucleoside-diphosphate kinase [Candidatus Hydrogenedentes bacterium]|nr:nucleoside-diphosphate kinase [Candidatus Hydrogenedentota bacterium]